MEGNENWIGIAYKLNLIYEWNNKAVFLIMSERRPFVKKKKTKRIQLALNNTYSRNVTDYIIKNNEFPYEWINYVEYHFITEIRDSDKGIYGQYRFKVQQSGLIEIDSNIELLEDKDAIINKIYSDW